VIKRGQAKRRCSSVILRAYRSVGDRRYECVRENTASAEQLDGVPCVRESRIPVATVVGMVADRMTVEETSPPTLISRPRTSNRCSATRGRRYRSVSFRAPAGEVLAI
jgi:Protein of unknown function (DUF433)